MRRAWIYSLAVSMLACSTVMAAKPSKSSSTSKQNSSRSENRSTKNAKPKTYENAEHKLRFSAPADWETVQGGCHGSIFNLAILPDFSSLPKPKPGEQQKVFATIFTVAANPLSRADADLPQAVKDVEGIVKADYPDAEFKPTEKTKIGGLEAVVVTASMKSKTDDEPDRVQRHVVFLREGKMYRMILYSHQNTIAKESIAMRNVEKSFAWTAEPSPVAAAAPAVEPAPAPASATKAAPDPSDGF